MSTIILGIESSCDDTSAAIIRDEWLLSNLISSQKVHEEYGGVVPELASRAHQANIIPVVDRAIKLANITADEISAVAFTRGPGLLGSLLVGTSFAKGFALAQNIPLIEVNHLHGHILSHFIKTSADSKHPNYPFLCLLVSGGHTQLVLVESYKKMRIVGKTIDDAAGEAFDKCAKVMGLGYPGGPVVDKLAAKGNPKAFEFAKPLPHGLDFSFSGLKTSFLYSLRNNLNGFPNFIDENKEDLCASLQYTITTILMQKLVKASKKYGIKEVAIAGGVAANSALRNAILETGERLGWNTYIPELKFTTDNAAMIAIAGYFKYLENDFAGHDLIPQARLPF
ncbi:MAG: tRNA (adenosine(37)-N6)-threonylcarbamoyltransferase complex transferase subunit TsaD [Bacteroidales bacterium]|jgi:N6-L-threonylcarbamoyladenine synthase|nr:tRNA (adenosine(37)-N6)-threonylcarbamoyltransferase complex transferase subunit TsaD [Bacteroidales bacterium]MDY0196251.1 tRNA (adenosine(37)-N6)-threonylcarbamoyltransferase complex transferase subunit TsaD [Tenuifilaceae bacterium]